VILKRILRIFLLFIGALIIIGVFLLTTVDRTPYKETEYYAQYKEAFQNIKISDFQGDTLQVGWAKSSIVPNEAIPMAGYGKRRGKAYTSIRDSVFAKVIVFKSKNAKAAVVSLDMLIVPPLVYKSVIQKLSESGYDNQNLFFTATHSHSSIGAWQPGFVGSLFSGDFDTAVVNYISDQVVTAIQSASQSTMNATIGFSAIEAGGLVTNRLVGDQMGQIDPWLRLIQIKKDNGETALFCSYAAHATCLGSASLALSGDYPTMLTKVLEEDSNVDFAMFGAGAVGSMKPLVSDMTPENKIDYLAKNLSDQILLVKSLMPMEYITSMKYSSIPVPIREPHFRIAKDIRVRPWVFNKIFGEVAPRITGLNIGNILLIGTPSDFSGELVENIDQHFKTKDTYLMIQSFNGDYIGYITDDQWYDLNKYETRTMNWFGPYNGAYFSEIIVDFGDKLIGVE
jgi:neutral ceramidase